MEPNVDSLTDYLTKLASKAPVPGGGSAAMVAGAEACALVAMVARICAGSPKYEAVHATAERLVRDADDLRARMLECKDRDEAAYDAVVAARGDKEAMQNALRYAAQVPLEGAQFAMRAVRLSATALELGNANLASDLGCAAEFGYAALAACAYNVRVNHKFMKDMQTVSTQNAELERLEREGGALLADVRRSVDATLRERR